MLSSLIPWFLVACSLNNPVFGSLRHRSKRAEDRWNSEDIFLCEVDRNDSIGFSLACDPKLACELTTSSPDEFKIIGSLLDLDFLTDSCIQPFYPSSENIRNPEDPPFHPFVFHQFQILQLTLWFTNFTTIPAGYLCKSTNLTSLIITGDTIQNTLVLGFHELPEGCKIPLENLELYRNHIRILNNASFLVFPRLKSLNLNYNDISQIEANAFEALENLQELQLNQNLLQSLSERVFWPLKSLLQLKLYKNRLTESCLKSFQLLPKLEVLDLYDNRISRVGEQDFAQFTNLRELNLGNNQLKLLESGIRVPASLADLNLASNQLSEVPESMFEAMPQLSSLDLRSNRITTLPVLAFRVGTILGKLDLSGNKLSTIPVLVNLHKVKLIDLSRNIFTAITEEDNDKLCNISEIETLNLSDNQIVEIHPNAFVCGNNLKNLHLDRNQLLDISDLFRNTNVSRLTVSRNKISQFSLASLSLNIVELDISRNAITNFSGIQANNSGLDDGMALRKLILTANKLQNISNLYFPKNLETLQLDSNNISHFSFPEVPSTRTARMPIVPPNLRVIDLTFNIFESACDLIFYLVTNKPTFELKMSGNPLQCPCELAILSNHSNIFVKTSGHVNSENCFRTGNYFTQNSILDPSKLSKPERFLCSSKLLRSQPICQCNLNSRYIEDCRLPCPQPCHCFVNSVYNVQITNCTHRNLKHVPEQPTGLIAEYLYMTNNELRYLGPSSLSSHFAARELYFQNNQLVKLHPEAFRDVPEVRILNLADNLLEQLPAGVFRHLIKIAEINLSNNKIFIVPQDTFKPMHQLEYLYLHSNLLQNLSVWDIHDLEPSQAFHLTLRKNPWSCQCEYVNRFRVWLQNFSHVVDDASDVFCTMDTGQLFQIPLISFNSSHCFTAIPAAWIFGNLTLLSSFISVLLFLTVISVLVFIYRAEVQVLVYSRYGIRVFHKGIEEDENKVYDAFLAYSSFDEEFVVDSLLPGLEQIENPYRMCIHQRDFLVGAIITESILEAVAKSRRTLILLSDHFVSSGWCRFEFKTAHLQMLQDRCSRVIIIILGDMPKNLDPEMQLYIKTNTYLSWNDHLFWKKLYFALPDRNHPKNNHA